MAGKSVQTNAKQAGVDMAHALVGVFKKHSLSSRRKAWETLTSKEGKKEMDKLVRHPDKPINTIQKLTFREWLMAEESGRGVVDKDGSIVDGTPSSS